MNNKGITPVIAIILLLLITIAVIGFATGFFQNIVTTTGAEAESAATATSQRLQKQVEFVAATGTAITVKNAGSLALNDEELSFLAAGVPIAACDLAAITDTATPGQVMACTGTGLCTTGQTITVTAPGNTVTGTCA